MFELAVQRDRKELFAHCARRANNFDAILAPNIGADHRRGKKQSKPALSKYLQQSTIFALGNDYGANFFCLKPLVERTPRRRIRRREQKRRAIEPLRKRAA